MLAPEFLDSSSDDEVIVPSREFARIHCALNTEKNASLKLGLFT